MEQRTTEWYFARKGKFTASEISNLLTSSRKKDEVFGETALTYIKEKVAEFIMNDDIFFEMQELGFRNTATAWGEQYEPEARARYTTVTGMEVEETGFFEYTEHSGGSPDGLCRDGEGIIEIKCPFNSAKHIEYLLMESSEDLLAVNKQYYWQCQANMLFTGRQYIDFVSYDPRISGLLRMKILRIEANEKDFDVLKTRIALAEERFEKMLSELTRIGIEQLKWFEKIRPNETFRPSA